MLTVQLAPFRDLLLDEVFCQTAAVCDRAKHSVGGYGGVFGENTRFSVYTRYIGVMGALTYSNSDFSIFVTGLMRCVSLLNIH